MGPNSKRAQAAGAASRNTAARARFSKPPPNKKKGGRGGGRGGKGGRGGRSGDSGGRGGRSGDSGGRGSGRGNGKGSGKGGDSGRSAASNASRANVIDKLSKRVQGKVNDKSDISKKHPLAGIDKSKLDEVTLSEELVQIVTKLLTDLNVMESSAESTSSNLGKVQDSLVDEASTDDNDNSIPSGFMNTEDIRGIDVEQEQKDDCNPDSGKDSPLFLHLTKQFSFSAKHAMRACDAIQNWSLPTSDDKILEEDGSTDELGDAIDWLCLHLTEDELKQGFKTFKTKKKQNTNKLSSRSASSEILSDGTDHVRVIAHPSISVAKSIASDKEWHESFSKEARMLGFVRLGFHKAESEQACLEAENKTVSNNPEDDGAAIKSLLLMLEKETLGNNAIKSLDSLAASDLDYVTFERDQEVVALQSIFDDKFEVRPVDKNNNVGERYVLKIETNDKLRQPSRLEESKLHVLLREGYPVFSPPMFLFTNPTLPPSLLRRINVAMINQAHQTVGDPLVFCMVSFLYDNLRDLQQAFTKEKRAEESKAEQRRKENRKIPTRKAHRIEEKKSVHLTKAELAAQHRTKQLIEEEAENVSRSAMAKAFRMGKSVEEAREIALRARNECLQHHGYEGELTDEVKKTHDSGKNDSNASDRENLAEKHHKTNVLPVDTHPSGFMESLRQSVKEASTVEKKNNSEDRRRGYSLTEPTEKNEPLECNPPLPAPVAVPTGDLGAIMKDVAEQQTEQPWLVSPEARVPLLGRNSNQLSPAQRLRQKKISDDLRTNLKRWHQVAEQCRQNGGVKGKDEYKMLSQRQRLPAYQIKEDIVKTIALNQITVVSGATGSGKSTQVPQLVLDDMIFNNQGSEASIIMTQPRRISAIGVADRIASERCEQVGDTIGYSIRLESKRSAKTRLLLCTTGILLRRLQCDPDLASVSHVFVDEVHERDINTDFLLIILKDLLKRRKNLKLVLMSATLNADTFAAYFKGCPTVSIPGRTFPVNENRLEDVLALTGYEVKEGSNYALKKMQNKSSRFSKSDLKKMYSKYDSKVISSLAIADESLINYELIAELLEHIARNEEEGAILVFMPGLMEITKAIEELRKKELFQDPSKAVIYPLHSSLSTEEQKAVFQVPSKGIRKVVVATNIAETSITIEDVVFVVDTGRVKENRQDEVNQMMTLVECWVSRSSAKQRRGRAGRVRPGIAYHLYSSHTNQHDMQEYQLPEMLRVGLEDLVLQILLLDLGEPSIFLTKAVNPPSALAIRNSLKLLEGLGAVDCDWRDVDNSTERNDAIVDADGSSCKSLSVTSGLTALGFHLATLPVDPRVGKMMIYGALFGCIDPALTIAASMSARNPFMSPFDKRDEADAARKEFATQGSDHLTTLEAFNQWKNIRRTQGNRAVQSFLRESFLSRMTLFQMEDLRRQYAKLLIDIGFLPKSFRLDRGQNTRNDECIAAANTNINNTHMIKAVLCAGLYPNIIVAPKNEKKSIGACPFQSLKGDVFLHPSTISFSAEKLDSNYCCYHEIVKTTKTYVRDCTPVSEFALLLFGGSLKVYHTHGVVTIDDWLRFRIAAKSATLVKHLRAQMEKMLLAKIITPEEDIIGSSAGRALIKAVSTLFEREIKDSPDVSEKLHRSANNEVKVTEQRGRGGRGPHNNLGRGQHGSVNGRGRSGHGGRGRRNDHSRGRGRGGQR